jgi:heat shock protein 5
MISRAIEALTARPLPISADAIYSMESQLKDKEGLGSKLDKKDRATIEDEIKEKKQWMEDAMSSATAEDFEDKLAEFQSVISVSS